MMFLIGSACVGMMGRDVYSLSERPAWRVCLRVWEIWMSWSWQFLTMFLDGGRGWGIPDREVWRGSELFDDGEYWVVKLYDEKT